MNYSKHYVTTLLLSVLVVAVIGTPAKAGDPLADKLGPGSGRASCGDQGQVTDPPFLKPDWWNDSDCGLVNFAYWEDLSGDGPWTPPDDPTHFCGWASATEFEISQTGPDVTMTLKNAYIFVNGKEIYAYFEGTGTPPSTPTIRGISSGHADSRFSGVRAPQAVGPNWRAWVRGRLIPQPGSVEVKFTLADGSAMTKAWAGECCHPRAVPTVSQWGLIVLTLLLLTGGAMVLRRRRAAAA